MEWLEVDVRASSLKDGLDCAMRYEAKHIRKIRMPGSGISHLGTALHKGTAVYDQSVVEGKPVTPDQAVSAFVDMLKLDHNPDEPLDDGVVWHESEITRGEAEAVGIKGVVNYITDIGSKRRYHAVEAKLEKFPIAFPEHKVTIVLTGTTDRVRNVSGDYGISDVKSGKTRVTQEKKVQVNAEKAQLAVYELIAEKSKGIEISAPAEIIGMSTAKHASVSTVQVPGTRAALVGTGETPGVLDFFARMLRSGVFPPNPASKLCSAKFCPIHSRCPFHD